MVTSSSDTTGPGHDTQPPVDLVALIGSIPDPVVLVSPDGVIRWGNDVAEKLFGWSRETKIGTLATELVHPDDLATALASLASVQEKANGTTIDIRVRERGGQYRKVEVRGRSALGVAGVDGIVLLLRDVTDRRRWELTAGDDAASTAVLEALPTITFVLSRDGRIESANRAFTRVLGHDLEATLGRPLTDFVSVADVFAVSESLSSVLDGRGRITFEADLVGSDESVHPMSITVVDLLSDLAVEGLVGTATDITDLAEVRDRLAHAATHDDLTGLPNRHSFVERLGRALSNAAMRGVGVAVAFVDLDDFKVVNDAYGHRAGDLALIEVGQRLRDAVRESDVVARYGGDEFVIFAAGLDQAGLARLVDRVSWLMRTPVTIGDGAVPVPEVRLTLSIGAIIATPGSDATDVIEQADAAMFRDRSRREHHA